MSIQRRPRRSPRPAQTIVGSALAFVILVTAFLLFRTISTGGQPRVPLTVPLPGTPTSEWFSVYFTDPTGTTAKTLRGGPDSHLAAAIDAARLSVDVAAYDLDLYSVRDAMIAAHRRGVTVRMVTDSDNIEEHEIQDLKDAGIPVLGDRHEGLMHDKFVVIDRTEVWSGSMNCTVNDAYKNNNNLIRIRSSRLAEDYSAEFEEMFVNDQFGPDSPANTPYPSLSVEGTPIEVYFSPDDGVAAHLVNLIQRAQKSVHFLAFSFTSDDIASAMLERARAGIMVSGIFEEDQVNSNWGDEYRRLLNAGLDVRLDGNPRNMHHKVIIIDGQTVVTGSYNFSSRAEEKNDENVLVIDSPEIARRFEDEFNKLLLKSQK